MAQSMRGRSKMENGKAVDGINGKIPLSIMGSSRKDSYQDMAICTAKKGNSYLWEILVITKRMGKEF